MASPLPERVVVPGVVCGDQMPVLVISVPEVPVMVIFDAFGAKVPPVSIFKYPVVKA